MRRILFVSVPLAILGCLAEPDREVPSLATQGTVLDAGADHPTLLAPLLATGFEPASAACNGWTEESASAIRSVPSRSGSYACKVCATDAAATLEIAKVTNALETGRYELSAWIRTRPDTPAPPSVVARIQGDGFNHESEVGIASDWVPVSVIVDLAAAVSSVRISVAASADVDQCLLFDDVAFKRVP